MRNKKTSSQFFLTGFGTGWLPIAPGTWGAALATLMVWPMSALPLTLINLILSVLIVVFLWIGVKGSDAMTEAWGKDPKQTVIDEMIGLWITLLGGPFTWPHLLAGFLLFRVFDIAKPFGIRQLERLDKGWGVMLDDVLAGVYANIVIQIGLLLVHYC
jgi:phosphatidylglycerophosphatase A